MADRSVSINLRARVSGFVAGMREAKGETQNLSRQMTETGASADRMRQRLEAATRKLPKIEIDADSTAAEVKFAQLRTQMDSLSDKKIGIDVSAADAMAQIREIERELEQLERNETDINVKADIGAALTELRAVDAEVSRLNGKDARVKVDANVGSALASIALVGAALASLPAVTTLVVGITALGGAFAAAGVGAAAFGAVAVPSLGRINEALKAQESAAKSAGSATGGAGRSAAQAAQQALQLEQAERRLKDAQNERKSAQEDLTRAVEAGRRALEDMNFSLERSILSQKDAALAIREAEARLLELQNDPDASALDIERAMLNVEMAHQRAREQETKTQRARQDTTKANREGVKGTAEYQKAQERLTKAEQSVTEAAQQLKIAQLQAKESMSGGGGAASKLADALGGLSKREKELAKDIKSFKDEYVAWQRSLQPDVFPVIAQGLDLMRLGLKEAGPLAKSASAAFLTLGKDAEAALRGPFWQEFLFDLNTNIPGAITSMGRIGIDTFTGFAGVIKALLPYGMELLSNIENLAKEFSEWGTSLEGNQQFHQFMADIKEAAPEVWELIKNIGQALLNVGEAIAPLGVGAFAGLGALAEIVASMDPQRIQTIALAIGAIKLASMGMGAMAAWQNLAGGITATGAAAGKAQGKMAMLGKAAIGVAAAVIGLEATGSAISYLEGQSSGIDKLTLSLTELGQTGKWAGDLEQQWGGALGDTEAAIEAFRNDLAALEDPGWYEKIFKHPFTELGALLPGLDSAVDRIEQRFTDMDAALAGMVQSGNADTAKRAFDQLAKQADAAGIPVEKLRGLLPLYGQAVRVAGNASAEAAAGVDLAKQRMDGFNSSLDAFASRTDALQAMQNLKTSYNEAEKAIEAASGKLQINAQMTDKQKAAVIAAREQFIGYIGKVKEMADGQATLSGRASDARDSILKQIPAMLDLAGKNGEARDQVLKLAEAYGISRDDAIKAARGGDDLLEVLAKLKSKDIRIGADTKPAQEAIDGFIRLNSGRKIPIEVYTKQTKGAAAGAIMRYAEGGIERYAAGGMRPQPPHMVSKPTVLYGEGSSGSGAAEAYIPYEMRFRQRAIDLLSQVASDFGLQVYGKEASEQVFDMQAVIDAGSMQVSGGLTSAMGVMTDTLGQAGTLTSAIDRVGSVGTSLADGWLSGSQMLGESALGLGEILSTSVDGMSEVMSTSIDSLSESVDYLGSAIGAARSAAGGKGSAGSPPKGQSGGSVIPPKPGAKGASGGLVPGSAGLSYTAHSSGLSMGGPVNSSKVSPPQQMHGGGGWAGAGGSGGPGGAGAAPTVVNNKSVNFHGTTIRETADASVMFAQASMHLNNRG